MVRSQWHCLASFPLPVRRWQTDDLPFRIFPSSAVLVDSSSAKRTVVEIIDGALEDGVPEELAELLGACRVVLSETHSSKRSEESGIADSSSGAGKVLHVLGHRKPGCVLRTG